MRTIDPVDLTQALIRRPSVTPADAGAMDVLQAELAALGFACRRMRFGEIENLYARFGTARPNLCFAGHTDVVPAGDAAAWSHDAQDAKGLDGALKALKDMGGGPVVLTLVALGIAAYGVYSFARAKAARL